MKKQIRVSEETIKQLKNFCEKSGINYDDFIEASLKHGESLLTQGDTALTHTEASMKQGDTALTQCEASYASVILRIDTTLKHFEARLKQVEASLKHGEASSEAWLKHGEASIEHTEADLRQLETRCHKEQIPFSIYKNYLSTKDRNRIREIRLEIDEEQMERIECQLKNP